jgi:hypothetical protein
MREAQAMRKNCWMQKKWLTAITLTLIGAALLCSLIFSGGTVGAQDRAVLITDIPPFTLTVGPVCTPPACKPGEVYYCPGFCPGGCGTQCATPTPGSTQAPSGALIELRVRFPEWIAFQWQELWTVVQWQDGSGHWHSVEGWQGSLDEVTVDDGKIAGRKVWWLAGDLFGRGPFRWLVYRVRAGKLVAESEPFNLPDRVGGTVMVETALVP